MKSPSPHKGVKREKVVKAWAVVFRFDDLPIVPAVFSNKEAAETHRYSREHRDNFFVVECTITYHLKH